jgi:hypothetical protein
MAVGSAGVADAEGDVGSDEIGDWLPPGDTAGEGETLPQPARNAAARRTRVLRYVGRPVTPLS